MVLERYEDAVIEAVTSPITGIQRTCKFPPSLAEMVEFVDEYIRRSSYASEWEARAEQQLREREEIEDHPEPLEHRKKVATRILEEYKAATVSPEMKALRDTWKPLSFDEIAFIYGKPVAKGTEP